MDSERGAGGGNSSRCGDTREVIRTRNQLSGPIYRISICRAHNGSGSASGAPCQHPVDGWESSLL